jgi:hypothetical protein
VSSISRIVSTSFLRTVRDCAFSRGLASFPVDVLGLAGEGARGKGTEGLLVFNQKLLHDYFDYNKEVLN